MRLAWNKRLKGSAKHYNRSQQEDYLLTEFIKKTTTFYSLDIFKDGRTCGSVIYYYKG